MIHPTVLDAKDIKLLKSIVGDKLGVKATGGVQRIIQALVMLNSGAERITLPNAVEILNEYETLVQRVAPYTK